MGYGRERILCEETTAQHANGNHQGEKAGRRFFGINVLGHVSASLGDFNPTPEEGPESSHRLSDQVMDLLVVGWKLEGGIDQEAAFLLGVRDRRIHDHLEEGPKGGLWVVHGLEVCEYRATESFIVVFERLDKELPLATEGIVEAASIDTDAFQEIANGGRLVPFVPENESRSLDGFIFTE